MITDGKHPAKLFDITFGTTNSGAPSVSFVWDLTDCNERVSYEFAMTDSAGRPNRFAILVTRRWSLTWDGTDLDWFREHRDELLGTPALVQTRGEKFEWITGEEREQGTGNREQGTGGEREQGTGNREQGTGRGRPPGAPQSHANANTLMDDCGAAGVRSLPTNESDNSAIQHSSFNIPHSPARSFRIKLVVDREKLAEMPERIEPTFIEAKTLFDTITEGTSKLDADLIWTVIAGKVGPMQIDFGEPEWTEMIERIRRLRSWEGLVSA